MPARRPAQARKIQLSTRPSRPDPTPEEIHQRRTARRDAILTGGPMRAVVQAVIESGEPMEIDTGTHVITITVAEK